jgi:hypothetical protein
MLDVTIAPVPCLPEAQVKLFDVLILAQGLSAAIEYNPTVAQRLRRWCRSIAWMNMNKR